MTSRELDTGSTKFRSTFLGASGGGADDVIDVAIAIDLGLWRSGGGAISPDFHLICALICIRFD